MVSATAPDQFAAAMMPHMPGADHFGRNIDHGRLDTSSQLLSQARGTFDTLIEEQLMAKLKLGAIQDDKPVKITFELSATVHRDLIAYADMLGQETGQAISDPTKLIAPMLIRFMATDKAFLKALRGARSPLPEAKDPN